MRQQTLKLELLIYCLVNFSIAMISNELESPRVGDWKNAIDENGLVRIPLKNPGGHSWYASL